METVRKNQKDMLNTNSTAKATRKAFRGRLRDPTARERSGELEYRSTDTLPT